MAGYGDVVAVFGEDHVVHLDRTGSESKGVDQEDSGLLERGLPIHVDVLFTLEVEGNPKIFSNVPAGVDEGARSFVLGGPTGVAELRYILDVRRGCVLLLALEEDGPQMEVINSTLSNFVDFLCAYAECRKNTRGAETQKKQEKARQLLSRLEEQDPLAFRGDDSWWSVVLDGLASQR